jgi:CRP-like cAMP-binding protein
VTSRDSEIWFLSRDRFMHLLVSSPRLLQAIHSWLRSPVTSRYLRDRQHMPQVDADAWLDSAVQDLIRHATVRPAKDVERNEQGFVRIAAELRRSDLFHDLPQGEIEELAEHLVHKHRGKGEAFYHAGELADRLYIVGSGEVALHDSSHPGYQRVALHAGAMFGVQSFLAGSRHSSTAVASEATDYWVLMRKDLPALIDETPVLCSKIEHALRGDAVDGYLRERHGLDPDKTRRWAQRAAGDLAAQRPLTAIVDMIRDVHAQHGAALAIWLGILLDSIPESLVLGTIQAKSSISLSLVAGLFISNYPEALSSSIGMRHQGLGYARILAMWSSLVLITGIGAAAGALFFGNVASGPFSMIEGIAAGAMLTMIAQTMLPEAYLKGGNVVGMATLLGFLTALFFRELG